jgi:hypothetical protein
MALTNPLGLDVWLGIDDLPLKRAWGLGPAPENCLIRVSYLKAFCCIFEISLSLPIH